MSKAFAHFLIDPEVAGMGFKTAIRHADGRHAAAGGAPEEYNSLVDRRKRYLRNPRALAIAEEIVRADVLERLAREGGNSDALSDAENHSLATIRRTEPTFGAEAGATGAAGGAGDGAAAGGDALINGLVESVARLTTELAEVRARVEVLEGQQPAEARRSDQQQE